MSEEKYLVDIRHEQLEAQDDDEDQEGRGKELLRIGLEAVQRGAGERAEGRHRGLNPESQKGFGGTSM